MNRSIVPCEKKIDIGRRVILWNERGGFRCPNPRGRAACRQHDPALNDRPTRPFADYRIHDPARALPELERAVHQLILHYDACYTSYHCHQLMKASDFKGSHFYLDLDGTLYQTLDMYWKTNTAPADDRQGNERAVHVEMANLSWEARVDESTLYHIERDQYQLKNGRWALCLPEKYRERLHAPNYQPVPARVHRQRGYFSRRVNGRVVRMWDFTEEQYQTLFALVRGLGRLLPGIAPRVPFDPETRRTPLNRITDFTSFRGILGHAHVQGGTPGGPEVKYDPGSAFDWTRLRKALARD
jgi:N-acetyl-anhydromuramyl-L-alanine amidase AmpD